MSNSHAIKHKTILITGGASGIGLGIAQQLGSKGHKVVIADMNMDAAEHAVAELGALGISARALLLDVTNQEHINNLSANLAPDTVDVLINPPWYTSALDLCADPSLGLLCTRFIF